jgi:hypothetical protein
VSEPQPDRTKKPTEKAAAIIGLASAALGLFVAFLGLPDTITSKLGRTESKAAKLELQQKRAEVAEAAARLDVKYIVMRYDLVNSVTYKPEETADPDTADPAGTLSSYHVAKTDVLDELQGDGPRPSDCWSADYSNLAVTFLAVSNRGKRDAAGVRLETDRLELGGVVKVREQTGGGDDYVAKLRGAARRQSPAAIGISDTLGPGDGVLIPLWLTGSRRDRPGRWCVVSRVAFEPRTVSFTDAVLGSTRSSKVRRMVAPTILASGVEGRG